MTLKLERLEGREVPAVIFNFNYDDAASAFFTPKMKETVALAARVIGEKLNPDPTVHGSHIDVNVTVQELNGAIARGGPVYIFGDPSTPYNVNRNGALYFDPRFAFHTALTELGITTKTDLFSVTSHELMHVLGIGTELNWADGSRARGVPIAPDGSHFQGDVDAVARQTLPPGMRYNVTAIDLAALNDLGWNVLPQPAPLGFGILSLVGPDNLARQYIVYQGLAFPTNIVTNVHLIYADFNYDGVPDLRVSPITAGYEFALDGKTGGLIEDPGIFLGTTFGINYLYQKY